MQSLEWVTIGLAANYLLDSCNDAQKPVVMFALVLLPSFVNQAMGL
jgi:hypothetical protein